jgi:menaquinone-dependent protoporphyrinogen IX oxidase
VKVLVTATSKHGATGEIANAIGTVLVEHGFDITAVPPH